MFLSGSKLSDVRNKYSFYASLVIGILLVTFRLSSIDKREISWDVLGYYLPLPATFIHHDPLLHDINWLKEDNKRLELSGTLYQVSQNKEGHPMYFFLFGMAIIYLPFFLIGHGIALAGGFPADGFSEPYAVSMVIGGLLFTLLGLYYLRKFLLFYLSDRATALVILILFLATNASHHLSLKNLETVNFLFTIASFTLYKVVRWIEHPSFKTLLPVGLGITFATYIKPSEIIICIVPLFWLVSSKETLLARLQMLWSQKIAIIQVATICLLILSPQFFYWYKLTGQPVYDSYYNPGVGLDLANPHLLPMLLSYRKGWLLYTPVMLFALAGMAYLYKHKRELFVPIAIYCGISIYIISSWTEWWYGASFSVRPMIILYPLLAIPMAYFIKFAGNGKKWITTCIFGLIILFAALNQFQWWQLRVWILDPYRTTAEYYDAIFLATSAPENGDALKLVNRDFSGNDHFEPSLYTERSLIFRDFNHENESVVTEDSTKFYRINSDVEYGLGSKLMCRDVVLKDHAWIEFTCKYKIKEANCENMPAIAIALDRKEGSYGYRNFSFEKDTTKTWREFRALYITPEIRSGSDIINFYVWNPGHCFVDIDDFRVKIFDPITNHDPADLIIF